MYKHVHICKYIHILHRPYHSPLCRHTYVLTCVNQHMHFFAANIAHIPSILAAVQGSFADILGVLTGTRTYIPTHFQVYRNTSVLALATKSMYMYIIYVFVYTHMQT